MKRQAVNHWRLDVHMNGFKEIVFNKYFELFKKIVLFTVVKIVIMSTIQIQMFFCKIQK